MKPPVENHSDRDYFFTLGLFSIAMVAFLLAHREPASESRPLSAWLRDLGAGETHRRARAEAALRHMGVRVVPALLARLESSNTNDHARAILGFAALGDAGRPAIPSLMALLRIKQTSLPAARALAAIGSSAAPLLTNSLTSPVGFIRSSSAQALRETSPGFAGNIPK